MRKIFFAVVALLIVGAGLFAAGKRMFHFENPSDAVTEKGGLTLAHTGEGLEMKDEERKILRELRELLAPAENKKEAFYIRGVVTTDDPARKIKDADRFVFYNNGEAVYCLSADQEMVYDKTLFVAADIRANSLLVGPPKATEHIDIPFAALSKNLKEEGYKLERSATPEGNAVIRMYYDNHITCKEMKVVFNEASRKLLAISYILTDAEHFDDASFDKKVNVKIEEWSTGKLALLHPFPSIVSLKDGVVTPAKGYENMNVINLNNQE